MKAIASILAVLVLAAAATYAWYADLLPWPQDGKAGHADDSFREGRQRGSGDCSTKPWCLGSSER